MFFVSFASAALWMLQAQGPPQNGTDPKKTRVSIERLLKYLQQPKRDDVSDAMTIKLIERFGLASQPTDLEIANLRSMAAPPELMHALEIAPFPKRVEDAALSITCAPVDCDVWIDSQIKGRTEGGTLPWASVRPGNVVLTAATDRPTEKQHLQLTLAPGERKQVHFAIPMSQNQRNELGARLFGRMLDAASAATSPTGDKLRATGNLYLRDSEGALSGWSIIASILDGRLVEIDVSRLRAKHTFVKSRDGAWSESAGRHAPKSLAGAVALLDGAMLPRRVELLRSAGTTILACNADGNQSCIRAAGTAGTYVVALDPLFRLVEIRESANGTDAPYITYLYADYSGIPHSMWANTIQVVRGTSQEGIKARFSDIQVAPIGAETASRKR